MRSDRCEVASLTVQLSPAHKVVKLRAMPVGGPQTRNPLKPGGMTVATAEGQQIGYEVRMSADADRPDVWRVTAAASDGTVFVTLFSGPSARAQADAYCAWQNAVSAPTEGDGRLRDPGRLQ
jgi:hypothetical protein